MNLTNISLTSLMSVSARQEATAVVLAEDGGYIVAGWTWGDYFDTNAGDDNDEGEANAFIFLINRVATSPSPVPPPPPQSRLF